MSSAPWWIAGALGLVAAVSLYDNITIRAENDALRAQIADMETARAERAERAARRSRSDRPAIRGGARIGSADLGGGAADDTGAAPPQRSLRAARGATSQPPIRIEDPLTGAERKARSAQQFGEQRARFMESLRDRQTEDLHAFADEAGWDDETRTAVSELSDASVEEVEALWDDMRDGLLDRAEAREEAAALSHQFGEELVELLGEDEAAAFQDALRGPLGSGPR